MKKISLLILSIFLLVSFSLAQNATWEYKTTFKDIANPAGIVKDTMGNIWYASKTAESGIVVVKKDGTPLSFSPIMSVTVGSTTVNTKTGCSGLQIDKQGNIYGIFNGNDLVKINPSDGTGMLYKQIPQIGNKKEISNFAIDTAGNIYFTHVEQPAPIQVYDKNFNKIKDIVPVATNAPKCKAITVTNYADWPDVTNGPGIQVYVGLSDGGSGIFHYRAYNFDSTFVIIDTMLKTFSNVEGFNWEPAPSKDCWVSNGTDKKIYKVFLGADYKNKPSVKDEISSSELKRPVGVVFIGDSCYIADYEAGKIHLFYKKPFEAFNNWKFSKQLAKIYTHGVAVDPDGNIWIAAYGGFDANHVPGKTLKSILVLKPDGTPKDTIWKISVSGIIDTLNNAARGIGVDYQGNILYSAYDALYKINYKTGQGMAKVIPKQGVALTKAVSDNQGNVAVAFVVTSSGDGIVTFTSDLIPLGAVVSPADVVNSFARDMTITPDGNDIYLGCTGGTSVAKYHSSNGIYGPYVFEKYIGQYSATGETVHLDKDGKLWIGSADHKRFDCWDLTTNKIVDGINAITNTTPAKDYTQGYFEKPRGIAFSPDGKTAYTCDFNGQVVQEWKKVGTGVEDTKVIPKSFELYQNYPNPFNPTTNFKYSLPKATQVKLVIYDIFGREVKTLINNEMKEAGTYTVTWDGKNNMGIKVSSGTYFYRMQAAGFEKVMKMALIK